MVSLNVQPPSVRSDSLLDRVGYGTTFAGGSGVLTLTAILGANVSLSNPAGSGKKLYLYRLVANSSQPLNLTPVINPTTNLPTVAKVVANNFIGHPMVATGMLKAEVMAPLVGGVASSLILHLPAGSREVVDLPPFVIPPGVTLAVAVPAKNGATVNLDAFWWEE